MTLTFGVRYEYPGDRLSYLRELNGRILAANGNNPVFRLGPLPETDTNNLMPRIGFNWNPRTGKKGIIGFFTGGDKLVVSGGYSRTYDPIFMNLYVNMGTSFPFVATPRMPTTDAFLAVRDTTVPDLSQANLFTRTVVSADIRSPATDQVSFEVQRQLARDFLMKIGYITDSRNRLIANYRRKSLPSAPDMHSRESQPGNNRLVFKFCQLYLRRSSGKSDKALES